MTCRGTSAGRKTSGVLDSGFFQVPEAQWGFASSPVLYDNKVLVQCDIQKGSFIAAFDLKYGREIWRTPRADVPTWSTPTVFRGSGRAQVVVNGWKHIGGYDVATGKELWRLTGGGDIPVPTPVVGHGLIFITNAHGRMSPIYAVRADASGDISLTGDATAQHHIAWSQTRGGAYMQTPLVYGDYLYNCRDNGCPELLSGNDRVSASMRSDLGTGRTGFTASSVAADGKIYFTSEEGEIFVVKAGPVFQVLSVIRWVRSAWRLLPSPRRAVLPNAGSPGRYHGGEKNLKRNMPTINTTPDTATTGKSASPLRIRVSDFTMGGPFCW
jgi:hypothetical protein